MPVEASQPNKTGRMEDWTNLALQPGKEPRIDHEKRRMIFEHAPELSWKFSADFWRETNERMNNRIDRCNAQVLILKTGDNATPDVFWQSLHDSPIGPYPVATTIEQKHGDGNIFMIPEGLRNEAQSIYVVASLKSQEDLMRLLMIGDILKGGNLNPPVSTALISFVSSAREDKEVSGLRNSITIRMIMNLLSSYFDRAFVGEPHSSGTQAFAAFADKPYPVAPMSTWKFLVDYVINNNLLRDQGGGEIIPSRENFVVVRPDRGRNLAAMRIQSHLGGLMSVSFDKERLSGTEVRFKDLTEEEQRLVCGKYGLVYDDEAASFVTLGQLAAKLKQYGMLGLFPIFDHAKLTNNWQKEIAHSLIIRAFGSDSLVPWGNPAMSGKLQIIPQHEFWRSAIEADIAGVNFWDDQLWKQTILQSMPEE